MSISLTFGSRSSIQRVMGPVVKVMLKTAITVKIGDTRASVTFKCLGLGPDKLPVDFTLGIPLQVRPSLC